MTVRTRFAPSPTGFMHVGGVRTALFAWLFARQQQGAFVLRIEDTDKGREVEGSIGHIMESLSWVGIEWDEGIDKGGPYEPYLQSARLDTYKKYATMLVEKGLAYPDPYTPEELEVMRRQAEAEKRPFLFRDYRPQTFSKWDGTAALRFKVPEVKRYTWMDIVRGELSAGEEALEDFILIKADGYPTYNFAHIVDDHEMKITHIVRSDEFISSTPKFLSLYDALEIKRPEFVTLPPILGPDGKKKLGKRDGAKDVLDYRGDGYLPEAIMNFLALLGWHPLGDNEILSKSELIAAFDPSKVQKAGARFDDAKLFHINQEWMRRLSPGAYVTRGGFEPSPMLLKAVPLLKDRARTFGEAKELLRGELACLFATPSLDVQVLTVKEPAQNPGFTKIALEGVLPLVQDLPKTASSDDAKETIMPYADQRGRGAVLWPLRYVLSGVEKSPDPFVLIAILGPEESALRIRSAVAILEQ